MNKFFRTIESKCNIRAVFLAFLWIASHICGVLVCCMNQSIVLLMRLAPFCQVTIVGLTLNIFLPLVIAFWCFYHAKMCVVYLLLVTRCFLSGVFLYAVSAVFGDSSWLVSILLFYSAGITNLILLWLFVFQQNRAFFKSKVNCYILFFIALLVAITDYCFVSPFLVSLMS